MIWDDVYSITADYFASVVFILLQTPLIIHTVRACLDAIPTDNIGFLCNFTIKRTNSKVEYSIENNYTATQILNYLQKAGIPIHTVGDLFRC